MSATGADSGGRSGSPTALVAAVGDGSEFGNGRELAAWVGVVPRQRSTGGRNVLLGIREGISIFARCSSTMARGRRCERHRGARIAAVDGLLRCSSAAAPTPRPWRWRTRTYERRGHCLPARLSTRLRLRRRSPFVPGGRAANGCTETVQTMARQVGPTHRNPVVIAGHQGRQSDEGGVCGFHRSPGSTSVPISRPDTWQQPAFSCFVSLLRCKQGRAIHDHRSERSDAGIGL